MSTEPKPQQPSGEHGEGTNHVAEVSADVAALQQQVEDVQAEWQSLTAGLQAQRERLETLLQSFPSAVEVSAVRALAMRVTHMEELVDQLLGEQRDASARRSSRTQLYVSITALVVTVALLGIFIVTNALKG
jgi:predicted  nucleic acid-binding Zn-ribbon protein